MNIRTVKYMLVFTLPALAWLAFYYAGLIPWLPLLYVFGLIPLMELIFRPDERNLSAAEEEMARNDIFYDLLLYTTIPVQYYLLFTFFNSISAGMTTSDWLGRMISMGLLCGVIGINVAHELGHRSTYHERFMAKLLLLTSLYMHFYIEHNRGHHRYVATPQDPASARYGEPIYLFWLRSVWLSYISAWRLETARLSKAGKPWYSFENEMLRMQIIQILFLIGIAWYFGWFVMSSFIMSACIGFLLLETVNYIEHYGLVRQKKGSGYERAMPWHSWNSNHILGRLMLFELSRHSDHHYIASRKYQILRHHDDSPQMPTGYPGMMLLTLIPPLWFKIMHQKIAEIESEFKRS
ncbi:MAG: alkane 1-monooxygenase [Cyclobacteriaceae bacterium]|nr:alkane 1-monooxygenase [Cyclobacteriaceae bacterium]